MADYLKHFRADSIVRDAELIRRELLGKNEQWTLLGQSYGGCCIFHYLSAAPEAVREAIVTGGIPSITRPAEDIYRASYPRVREKNRLYFERLPGDQERAQEIAAYLTANKITLPGGGSPHDAPFPATRHGFGYERRRRQDPFHAGGRLC